MTADLEQAERTAMRRTLIIALLLRLAAATMFALLPKTRIFHEDASGYEYFGMRIADGWTGRGPPFHFEVDAANHGFYYFAAAIYYVFAGVPSAVSYVNAVIGCLTVLYVYKLSRRFFHSIVGRLAASLTAYTPSMILWSSVAIKDPLMTLLVLATLDGCVQLKRRMSIGALLKAALPIVAMQPIRFYMVYFLTLAVIVSMVLERGGKFVTGLPKQLLLGGAVVGLLVLVGFSGSARDNAEQLNLERLSSFRHGMAVTANSGFSSTVDVSTPAGALAFLPIGVSALLLSPFPWQLTSLRASFAAPEMLVWWFIFPSMIGGLALAVKRRFTEVAPLVLFAAMLTAAYGLMQGNVGSAFRQRAQIFVVLFIFTALGWYRRKCRRHGIDEMTLLTGPLAATPSRNSRAPTPYMIADRNPNASAEAKSAP
jgi:hypothetical protein